MKTHYQPIHECINLRSKVEFQASYIKEIPKEERQSYIENNSPRLREMFCLDLCPVGKFYRRYG